MFRGADLKTGYPTRKILGLLGICATCMGLDEASHGVLGKIGLGDFAL